MTDASSIKSARESLATTINEHLSGSNQTYQQFAGRAWEKLGYNCPGTLTTCLNNWTHGRRPGYSTPTGKEKHFTPDELEKLTILLPALGITDEDPAVQKIAHIIPYFTLNPQDN